MPTQDEVQGAISEIDARIDGLRERILASGDAALAEGEWSVRDALSHLAARSNGVPRVLQRVEEASQVAAGGAQQPGGAPPPMNIDDINAGQVEEHADRSVLELLDEIRDGHRAAIAAVTALDESLLQRSIPRGFRPGDTTVGEMLIRGGPGHDGSHLDLIEAALPA